MNITVTHCNKVTCAPEPGAGVRFMQPRIYESLRISNWDQNAFRLPSAKIVKWIPGDGQQAFFYSHFHDGTLLFDIEAAMILANCVQELIEAQGGEWEVSHVAVAENGKTPPKSWMKGYDYLITFRRLDADMSGQKVADARRLEAAFAASTESRAS